MQLYEQLYDYQKEAVRFALQRRGTLLADEMGLGKTPTCIGVVNEDPLIQFVLVVCPASLILNWKNEITAWCKRQYSWWPYVTNASLVWRIVSIDSIKPEKIPTARFDLLILDEAHRIKNPKTARYKNVSRFAKIAKRTIFASGTPIENRPVELWPLLQLLAPTYWDPAGEIDYLAVGPGEGAGYKPYIKRYCDLKTICINWRRADDPRAYRTDVSGASNLDELNARLRESVMIRRLKADVLKELPPKRRQIVVLPSKYDDSDLLAQLGEIDEFNYEEQVRKLRSTKVLFTEWSRRRHEQALDKIPEASEFVADALDTGDGKIIVFGFHLDVIEALAARLKSYKPVQFTGEMTKEARDLAVRRFQEDKRCRVFIGTDAAGEGITLTASSHVIFIEEDPVPGRISQKEDRAHRIGQVDSVLVQHLVQNGTLDARMCKIAVKKQGIIKQAIDG